MSSMNEHIPEDVIQRYQQRKLAPLELLTAEDYASACPACRAKLRGALSPAASAQALRMAITPLDAEPFHADEEQLAAFLDGNAHEVDREIVTTHLANCRQCAANLEELRTFRALMTAYPAKEHRPAPPRTLLERLFPARTPRSRQARVLSFGVAATVIVLLLVRWSGVVRFGGASVALNDGGGQVALGADGHISGLPQLTPDLEQTLKTALSTGRIQRPSVLTQLASARTGHAFDVEAPIGTVVESNQPAFTWKLPPGAVGCKISLAALTGGGKSLVTKMLTADHWKPKKALVRGAVYRWTVTAFNRAGKPVAAVPEVGGIAQFKVLDQAGVGRIADARRRFAGSRLALGVIYAEDGLVTDAVQEFAALHAANPRSPVAKSLEDSAQALLGNG